MKITVIGAGNMGSAFVKQLTRAGHRVSLTARDSGKAAKVAAVNPGATVVAASRAAEDADAVPDRGGCEAGPSSWSARTAGCWRRRSNPRAFRSRPASAPRSW